MTQPVRNFLKRTRPLLAADEGAVMTEAILIVPIITLLAVAILEFGAIFWQREQIITGLRDAVRYAARCHADAAFTSANCDDIAKKIAYYGNVNGTGLPRVPEWESVKSPITITRTAKASQTVVSASTTHTVLHTPLFAVLGVSDVKLTLSHEQRVIGW